MRINLPVILRGLVIVPILMAGTFMAASPALAHAPNSVGCYGDYCSGQNPETTGCSADAVTVAYTPFNNGILELRWSNVCRSNWARINVPYNGSLKARQSTGYTQSLIGFNVTFSWTAMIYSPSLCVRAQVVSSLYTTQTACV